MQVWQDFLGLFYWNGTILITIGKTMNRWVSNGPSTSNLSRFDVDIISINWKKKIDEFPCRFEKLFRCNFDRSKIDLDLECSIQHNFYGRKMYFLWRNFEGQNFCVVSRVFEKSIMVVVLISLLIFNLFKMKMIQSIYTNWFGSNHRDS